MNFGKNLIKKSVVVAAALALTIPVGQAVVPKPDSELLAGKGGPIIGGKTGISGLHEDTIHDDLLFDELAGISTSPSKDGTSLPLTNDAMQEILDLPRALAGSGGKPGAFGRPLTEDTRPDNLVPELLAGGGGRPGVFGRPFTEGTRPDNLVPELLAGGGGKPGVFGRPFTNDVLTGALLPELLAGNGGPTGFGCSSGKVPIGECA